MEQLHQLLGAALFQNVLQEGVARGRVKIPSSSKREKASAESTSAHQAVVARRVAAREDVGEAVLEAVERPEASSRRPGCAPHPAAQDLIRSGRVKGLVQTEVEQGELQLAQHLHRRLEAAGGQHLLQQIGGQRLPVS